MIVSWNWLKEYVSLDMSVDALVERLMMAGFNHESTEDVDGDFAIDLEITSNRPDCLGHLGIAREVAVLFGKELKRPPAEFSEGGQAVESLTSVVIEPTAAAWCPQYRARIVENVQVGPSPLWMQRRLKSLGLTPINNVVDITNYVLMECGQPLHAFDFDKLIDKKIVVRNAQPKEAFLAINNRTYELNPSMGVIADGKRAVAVAGVMGGADTEVGPTTTRILLEAAEFMPVSIRRTGRALDLSSDASYRFERKIDPAGVAWASDRATHLIQQLAKGSVAKGFIHAGKSDFSTAPIAFRPSRVSRLLGIAIAKAEARKTLTSLGVDVTGADGDDSWQVKAPTFRRDLFREIDFVEEVGRIHGYADVPENVPLVAAVGVRSKQERVVEIVRSSLVGTGYCEAVTFSFTNGATATSVKPWTDQPALAVRHSSRKQENTMRQSLLGSLLVGLRTNESRGNEDVRLFEIAHGYIPKAGEHLPTEPLLVGLVAGQRDFREARGLVESIFEKLRMKVECRPTTVPGLDSGRTAEWLLDGKRIGVIGHVDKALRDRLDLRCDPICAELESGPLVTAAQLIPKVTPLPELPAMIRDLAVVLDEAVRWSDLEATVRSTAGPRLESLEFVDLYRGKQVAAGKKSIAFRLTYRAPDRTLTKEEVDGFQQTVVDAIAKSHAGELRK